MGFRIQTNVTSMNAHRHLTTNDSMMNKTLERLASGYRINSAADDAAGMAASLRFRSEISALEVASRNTQQATSLLQVAEGAFTQMELMLLRLKELATQAASGNAGVDLEKIDAEATQLEQEMTRIIGATKYNQRTLLDGSFGGTALSSTSPVDFTAANGVEYIDVAGAKGETTYSITSLNTTTNSMTLSDGSTSQTIDYTAAESLNPNENFVFDFSLLGLKITVNEAFDDANFAAAQSEIYTGTTGEALFQIGDGNIGYAQLGITLPDLSLSTLAGGANFDVDLTSLSSAQTALDDVDAAISKLALERGDIGAYINRLSYASANLAVSIENKIASESVIRDVDMAAEMSEFTKYNILVQAGVSMLAQANTMQNSVLNLLRG